MERALFPELGRGKHSPRAPQISFKVPILVSFQGHSKLSLFGSPKSPPPVRLPSSPVSPRPQASSVNLPTKSVPHPAVSPKALAVRRGAGGGWNRPDRSAGAQGAERGNPLAAAGGGRALPDGGTCLVRRPPQRAPSRRAVVAANRARRAFGEWGWELDPTSRHDLAPAPIVPRPVLLGARCRGGEDLVGEAKD